MMLMNAARPRIRNNNNKKKEATEEDENQHPQSSSSQQQRGFRRRATTALTSFSPPSRNRHLLLLGGGGGASSSHIRSFHNTFSNRAAAAPTMVTPPPPFGAKPSSSQQQQQDDDASTSSFSEHSVADASMASSNSLNHTIVLYQPSTSTSSSFYGDDALSLTESWWSVVQAAQDVVQSREAERLASSSCQLVHVASRTAVRTALLPVTVPLHLATTSTRMVLNTSKFVVWSASDLVLSSLSSSSTTHESSVQDSGHGLLDIPGQVLCFCGHVTDEVGGILFQLLVGRPSSISISSSTSGQSSAEEHYSYHHRGNKDKEFDDDDFLNRLRLDYYGEPDVTKSKKELQPQHDHYEPSTTKPKSVSPPPVVKKVVVVTKTSKFLMRVDDLELYCKDALTLYIDLDGSDTRSLTLQALQEFTHAGLSMLANHPSVRLNSNKHITTPRNEIVWKCENSCSRTMRQMSQMSTSERLKTLEKETLVWSGQFRHSNLSRQGQHDGRRSNMSLYLARGMVRCRPREFVNLLWDNDRTHSYNHFCLGRTTVLDLDDSQRILTGASDIGTKVITSETRIPFTGMSVSMYCLMHVRPLDASNPQDGYVIMSRSLVSGTAGTHTSANKNKNNNFDDSNNTNEIIWGINILRRVPNHPHLTDLTSLSQGGSSLVPKFLMSKIAMMGISEFFDNVRKLKLDDK